MFTGIIEELGRVKAIHSTGETARITIHAPKIVSDVGLGDSIAVNGVCLTAVNFNQEEFTADVSAESLRRTTLGRLKSGSPVNLERPMQLNGRLGGHLVQGHVDGVAEYLGMNPEGDSYVLRFRPPASVARYVVEKGSITLNGISLTISRLTAKYLEVAIIPHTWKLTNLSTLVTGDFVNVEVDIVAKYVERLLGRDEAGGPEPTITTEYLKEQGY